MGRRDSRRNRRRKGPPQGGGQQAAASGKPDAETPAAPSPGAPAAEEAVDVPRRHTIVIPRSAGVASWVSVAALIRHPYWKELVDPEAAVVRAAIDRHGLKDLPSPEGDDGEPMGQRLERRGYLLLGVGDGTGSFEDRGPEAILDQLCGVMAAGFADPSAWVRGDSRERIPRYPEVSPTPGMVVRALWLLVDRGVLAAEQAEEACRELGELLFERMVTGGLNKPQTANIPALAQWQRLRRKPWTLGKMVMRAILATHGWHRQAAADWAATGRSVTLALPDAAGVAGPVRLAFCRSESPMAVGWIRAQVPADIVVRVEDGGFFAQVVGRTGAVRQRLSVAAGLWRRALLNRQISEEEAAAAGKSGLLSWSPIYLDDRGACAANRHDGDPYIEDLPFSAAELQKRLLSVLEMG